MDAIPSKTLQTPTDFVNARLVAEDDVAALTAVAARYAAAVPPTLYEAIATTGIDGPLARQFVPSAAELSTHPDERDDPIGDQTHSPVKGIVHRYPDRVLLMPTHVCAVYCRFCFRRAVVGPEGGTLTATELSVALDYIARTPAVWEVILTGGDPLVLSPRRLSEIITRLDAIPHVAVLRIHTRVPVAAPERIDDALLDALSSTRKTVYAAIHCNHPAELTPPVRAACTRMAKAGLHLLAQSVLLKGVNDSADVLEQLMRALTVAGIRPYYLHHLDLAPGTGHFRVPLDEGRALMRILKGRLSGVALPTYVLDIPGGHGKVPISAPYVTQSTDGYVAEDHAGIRHPYPPAGD